LIFFAKIIPRFSGRLLAAVCCLWCITQGQAQNPLQKVVDFSCSDQTISQALRKLADDSDENIIFSDNFFINENKRINFYFRQKNIAFILEKILEGTYVGYSVTSLTGTIVLYRLERPEILWQGQVVAEDTHEPLPGATVYAIEARRGAVVNDAGSFALRLPGSATYTFKVRYVGYEDRQIGALPDRALRIALRPVAALAEVQVVSSPDGGSRLKGSTAMLRLPEKWTRYVISTAGEPDLIRQISILPGFQTGADGFGGLHVRGGNSDQNLVLLDGIPVYNPTHAAGIFSIFNPALVQDVRLYKGNTPAQFGGRLSSVLDVRLREGNTRRWRTEAALSPVSGSLLVDGPLGRRGGSLLLSGRVSWVYWLAQQKIRRDNTPNFREELRNFGSSDFYLKWVRPIGTRHRLAFTTYLGGDQLQVNQYRTLQDSVFRLRDTIRAGLVWGNSLSMLRWQWQPHPNLFGTTTLAYTGFNYLLNIRDELTATTSEGVFLEKAAYLQELYSLAEETSLRSDWVWEPRSWAKWRFGSTLSEHAFSPTVTAETLETADSSEFISIIDTDIKTRSVPEWATYSEIHLDDGGRATLTAGLRAVHFGGRWSVQPRIHAGCLLVPGLLAEVAWAKHEQFIHTISLSDFALPTDVWLPVSARSPRQTSRQLTLGLNYRLRDSLHLHVEWYRKRSRGLVGFSEQNWRDLYPEGLLFDVSNWDSLALFGSGRGQGLELLLEKRAGRLTGLLSYTLSRAWRTFDGVESPYRFDTRNSLSISSVYRFNNQWHIAALWQYNDGFLRTDLSNDAVAQVLSSAFGTASLTASTDRLPNFHRLDLTVGYTHAFKNVEVECVAGIYNVYNRRNLLFVQQKRDLAAPPVPAVYEGVRSIPVSPIFRITVRRPGK
jgi:CarboxypepD_reg-like domain/TonB-dependent Receptor Plug Domain